MHPILFEISAGFTIYTYGVLLAAAYLLGLQFALMRARRAASIRNRVMDLGIWIIISAPRRREAAAAGRRLPPVHEQPGELLDLVRSGGVFYGGLIAAVVVALF